MVLFYNKFIKILLPKREKIINFSCEIKTEADGVSNLHPVIYLLWLIVFEELIQITRYHTVVELFHLVGALAVKPFKAIVRGYDVHLPRSE